jgi:hypothetical protein
MFYLCLLFFVMAKPNSRGTNNEPRSSRNALDAIDGVRARKPSVDQPLKKSLKRGSMKHLPWKEIEVLYCSGVSSAQLAAEYPPATTTAIEKRASRNEWLTPSKLRAKAKALIARSEKLADEMPAELMEKKVIDDPAEALALKIVQGRVAHRNNILNEVDRSMKKLKKGKALAPKSIGDLDKLDQIARRSLNLDAEEAQNKFIINLNAFSSAPEVIDV